MQFFRIIVMNDYSSKGKHLLNILIDFFDLNNICSNIQGYERNRLLQCGHLLPIVKVAGEFHGQVKVNLILGWPVLKVDVKGVGAWVLLGRVQGERAGGGDGPRGRVSLGLHLEPPRASRRVPRHKAGVRWALESVGRVFQVSWLVTERERVFSATVHCEEYTIEEHKIAGKL